MILPAFLQCHPSGIVFDEVVTHFEQAGCSSSTQELTSYSHRACQSALGSGIYTNRECTVQVRAGKGPPKQGRGYNSKKAAADGIRKIMRGRDPDNAVDGWTQVRDFSIFADSSWSLIFLHDSSLTNLHSLHRDTS